MQRFCKAIVAVSRYDYENLLSEGINQNVSYVYNAITRPDTHGMEKPEVFSCYDKTVLAIARVASPKRHDLFIELSRRLPQYGFVWIGNQENMENLPKNCHFLGNIPNAGAYCHFADVFCLPSDYEGLPMVILEAMSFGKPIIASNVGGIKEIVLNGDNGYVLENDPTVFADMIQLILSDNAMLNSMSRRSEEIFKEMLTIDNMVDGYMNVYTD